MHQETRDVCGCTSIHSLECDKQYLEFNTLPNC